MPLHVQDKKTKEKLWENIFLSKDCNNYPDLFLPDLDLGIGRFTRYQKEQPKKKIGKVVRLPEPESSSSSDDSSDEEEIVKKPKPKTKPKREKQEQVKEPIPLAIEPPRKCKFF